MYIYIDILLYIYYYIYLSLHCHPDIYIYITYVRVIFLVKSLIADPHSIPMSTILLAERT